MRATQNSNKVTTAQNPCEGNISGASPSRTTRKIASSSKQWASRSLQAGTWIQLRSRPVLQSSRWSSAFSRSCIHAVWRWRGTGEEPRWLPWAWERNCPPPPATMANLLSGIRQTRKQQKFNAVKPEYLTYSDCRIYLFPDPIKLVSTAANDLLGMLIEHGHPCLTSGIRDLEDHDVSEGCREPIRFGTK